MFYGDIADRMNRSLGDDLVRIYTTAFYNCYSDKELLSAINQIYNETYHRLPEWSRSSIQSIKHQLFKIHQNNLWWTHVIDGVRYWSGGIDQTTEILDVEHSAWCYAVHLEADLLEDRESPPGAINFIPYQEEHRQKDIEFLLINPNLLTMIRNPIKNNIKVFHYLPETNDDGHRTIVGNPVP